MRSAWNIKEFCFDNIFNGVYENINVMKFHCCSYDVMSCIQLKGYERSISLLQVSLVLTHYVSNRICLKNNQRVGFSSFFQQTINLFHAPYPLILLIFLNYIFENGCVVCYNKVETLSSYRYHLLIKYHLLIIGFQSFQKQLNTKKGVIYTPHSPIHFSNLMIITSVLRLTVKLIINYYPTLRNVILRRGRPTNNLRLFTPPYLMYRGYLPSPALELLGYY